MLKQKNRYSQHLNPIEGKNLGKQSRYCRAAGQVRLKNMFLPNMRYKPVIVGLL
jgi:hypothetical protein